MSALNLFVVKSILLLWVVCAVLCHHQKRDVHHRIIIKQRIPRSHKRGQNHGRDHKHHHHAYKKEKRHHSSLEKDSDEDISHSKENSSSFEDIDAAKKYKARKPHQHHDTKNQFQDFDEPKPAQSSKYIFQNEWTPMNSEQLFSQDSHETFTRHNKKKRDYKKSYLSSLKPPPVDLTTSFPFQFTSTFPQFIQYSNAFSNFDLNKKVMESNQSPLIGTIEHPQVEFSQLKDFNSLGNHRASYEVTELTPAGSNTNTFIAVPDDMDAESSNKEEATTKTSKPKTEEVKSTQRPVRGRGRAAYRGQKKA
ncbi:hypothetical protein NQ315_006413 [Exocentrus adspersus]|uniref:Uncharacterized protein n=1 Tax=Exocentrus adspersus TaxID=1586481 RepID=A0AAV8VZW8_9CUCU|nr:hypothetical protein NQ315_006413 [Exocentrus adspersus]